MADYIGNSITPLPHFHVQYHFDNEEHPISFTKSHGNSKNPTKIIQHTTYSLRNQIKNLAREDIKGKEIFNRVMQIRAQTYQLPTPRFMTLVEK